MDLRRFARARWRAKAKRFGRQKTLSSRFENRNGNRYIQRSAVGLLCFFTTGRGCPTANGALVVSDYLLNYTGLRYESRQAQTATGLSDTLLTSTDEDVNVSNRPGRSCILTVNGGSSSLKFALFDEKAAPNWRAQARLGGEITRIGLPDARLTVVGPDGNGSDTKPANIPDLGGGGRGAHRLA